MSKKWTLFCLFSLLWLTACEPQSGVVVEESTSTTTSAEPGSPPASVTEEGPSGSEDTTTNGEFPLQLETERGPIDIATQPQSIISLSPTATEILFAIGAGSQVVAVDDQSNYPPEAPRSDLSGFTPNTEAILGMQPDLVVLSYDPGDLFSALELAEVPVIYQSAPEDLSGTYRQISELGRATGNQSEAEELVVEISAEANRWTDHVLAMGLWEGRLTFYHELDNLYYTLTSDTFIGQVYQMFGLFNIADEAEESQGNPYPQLSAEFILDTDPDLIYLADTICCGVSVESVSERPGWSELRAVQNGQVFELNDDIASRWGPRIVNLMQTLAATLGTLVTN